MQRKRFHRKLRKISEIEELYRNGIMNYGETKGRSRVACTVALHMLEWMISQKDLEDLPWFLDSGPDIFDYDLLEELKNGNQ